MTVDTPEMSRRGFIKGSAGAAALAVVGPQIQQQAQALVMASPGLSWGMRVADWTLGGIGDSEGMEADVLQKEIIMASQMAKSQNDSTIVDNENLMEYVGDTAYTDGKIKAIEEMKKGSRKKNVREAGKAAISEHFSIPQENLIKSWNECIRQFRSFVSSVHKHDDLKTTDIWNSVNTATEIREIPKDQNSIKEQTLADGSTMDVLKITVKMGNDGHGLTAKWTFNSASDSPSRHKLKDNEHILGVRGLGENGLDSVAYLWMPEWRDVWQKIEETHDNILSNFDSWLENAWGKVQNSDIDPDELKTPREWAEQYSDDSQKYAIADALALNLPMDYDNKVKIKLLEDDKKMSGILGTSDPERLPKLEEGDQIDPLKKDDDGNRVYGDIYMATNLDSVRSKWSDFEPAIDAGYITFTSDPGIHDNKPIEDEGYRYTIKTKDNETIKVKPSSFSETSNGKWEVGVSEKLENDISKIESVELSRDKKMVKNQTITQPFEMLEIKDGDKITFGSPAEPQRDNNYLDKDDYENRRQARNEEIKEYNNSDDSGGGSLVGGGGGGGNLFGGGSWFNGAFGDVFGGIQTLVLGFLGVAAGIFVLNAASG